MKVICSPFFCWGPMAQGMPFSRVGVPLSINGRNRVAPLQGLITAILFLLVSFPLYAEDPAIAKLFNEAGTDGTLVIASLNTEVTYVHNDARARRRFPTASTFKILNTLIALEVGAISGKEEVLRWDGHRHDFPDWNRDQTLESAFKVSCVWCYQEIARRVGADRYRRYLRETGYGELAEPFDETAFWLDGSLRISAVEQVEFLKRVYRREPPFRASAYETLREIMLVEETPTHALRAKTGWAARSDPPIGWFVGYVESPRGLWVFALNLDIGSQEDLPLRQELTRAALREKGVIE